MRFADLGTAKERKFAEAVNFAANWKIRQVPAAAGRRGPRELRQLKRRSDRMIARLEAAVAGEKDEVAKKVAEGKLEVLKAGRARLDGAKVSGDFTRALRAVRRERLAKLAQAALESAGVPAGADPVTFEFPPGAEQKIKQHVRRARWANRRRRRDDALNRAAMLELAAPRERPRAVRRDRARLFRRVAAAKVLA